MIKRKGINNIIAAVVLGLLVLFICFISYRDILLSNNYKTLVIEYNGQIIKEVDGKTIDINKDTTFRLENDDAYNVISIKTGKIACIESNCPDQVCVHKGFISGKMDDDMIVCMPHKMVICFK